VTDTIHIYDPITTLYLPFKVREIVGGENDGKHVGAHDVMSLPGTVEPDIAAMKADIALIKAAQAVPAAGPKFGYVSGIGTGSNVNFATKTLTRGCNVTNLDATNNLLIRIGGNPGATDVDTLTVLPKQQSGFIACTDPNTLNMRSSASTVAACYVGS
jgi:hypothetical protein